MPIRVHFVTKEKQPCGSCGKLKAMLSFEASRGELICDLCVGARRPKRLRPGKMALAGVP